MSLTELMGKTEHRSAMITGVVVGEVVDNEDPKNMGRVQLKFPRLSSSEKSAWARIAAPMAGKNKGMVFIPDVGDEVLVAFEYGDITMPYVVGALWNGKDTIPYNNSDKKNAKKLIQTKNGHVIEIDETSGAELIKIEDKSGKNSITVDITNKKVLINAAADIKLSADGDIDLKAKGDVTIDGANVTVKSKGKIDVDASGKTTVKGSQIELN